MQFAVINYSYSFETEFWYIYVLYWINLLLWIFFSRKRSKFKIKYQFPSIIIYTSIKCQCIMLLNLNSRRSGIQTDLCPFIKVRRSICPLLPWPSIWIHSEMSDTGRAMHLYPPLKSWEGHVSPPSADPRWHVINSEMSDIGRVTCAPPPFLKLWEGHVLPSRFPLLIHSEAGPPVPPSQKLGGARVLSFRLSSLVEMPGTSRFAHFTPLMNWLIKASAHSFKRLLHGF